ncbi:efflux RND transporter periplasmic adaptor subunit [Vibrio fluvialis]|uniref:efflux RND transporter periplasmic adaptor subunit n=1 Tax=Vibrio fluvialis TaxID=676 RepID=UPI001ABE308A|nr:efflux RND transporter periplasmic adaptor subunit [Vibrio fluvialis]ELO1814210.1 efflux RND transporter periplasmic adaptor subunit [Vibrio fluvialis]MBY7807171.1 efflux RND transporter periplasmic adaptor subunit [Vibrio fluvialis]MBY8157242.1 efflux RND transporter periplasmic adaptor subunit [Vibrio fluvialis]QTH07302.1 efflux RND transporter periplasmic adaptor subunit [Vibrio fluvialis]
MKWLTLSIMAALSQSGLVHAETVNNVFTVKSEPMPQVIQLDGVVEPVNQGTVAAQTSGRVIGVFVDVNDHVTQGQVLLEISDVQQSASLDAAQAQLASALAQNREAQAQVNRYRQLFPKGAISRDQMDSAEARARSAAASVKSAQAAVAQAKESLGYTNITAPYAGVVTQRHVELGETVAPGTPLISGFSLEKLRVETDIPQRYQDKVKEEAQFHVLAPSGDAVMPTDYSLFSYADPQSHNFKIRLSLPDNTPLLVPGMWVKTDFQYSSRDVLLVPSSAVIRRAELSAVYRIVNDARMLNPIRLGQTYGDYVEVLSGLEPGDVIATTVLAAEGQ